MAKTTSTRITWTNNEKSLLSDKLVKIFIDAPWTTNLHALREAQVVLPAQRRITINHGHVFNHKERVRQARKLAETLRAQTIAEKPKPKPIPAPVPVHTPIAETKPESTPIPQLSNILDQFVDLLAAKIAKRLNLQAFAATATERQVPKHNPQPIIGDRPAKLGVLIVGLLDSQAAYFDHNEYPHLDITCLTAERALKAHVQRAHTILMTKFINHAVQDHYRKRPNLHFCDGGLTDLDRILERLEALEQQTP